jgi:hypothetical protein
MPLRELSKPQQIIDWLVSWGNTLSEPGELILIGSGGLLWHAHRIGSNAPLPENSMDVDPITSSEAVAELAYNCLIGSDFEKENGWHVNLMPDYALRGLPEDWKTRSQEETYGNLTVIVPSSRDLLVPKLQRNEPRDLAHKEYALSLGLID